MYTRYNLTAFPVTLDIFNIAGFSSNFHCKINEISVRIHINLIANSTDNKLI